MSLESLDNEGVIQLPPDQAADLLYRLDGDHQDLHDAEEEGEEENGLLGGEREGVGRDDSAHWNRLRLESRMGRRWWKRPSPYWSVAFTLTDLLRTTVADLATLNNFFAGSFSSRSDMPSRWALASRQRARSTTRLPGKSSFRLKATACCKGADLRFFHSVLFTTRRLRTTSPRQSTPSLSFLASLDRSPTNHPPLLLELPTTPTLMSLTPLRPRRRTPMRWTATPTLTRSSAESRPRSSGRRPSSRRP